MKQLFKFVIVLACVVTFSACGSDSPTGSNGGDKKPMLAKPWKVQEGYIDSQSATSVLGSWRIEYKNNLTYEGFMSGNPVNGIWEFNTDESRIILDKGTSDELTWTITELTSSKLKVTFSLGGSSFEIIWIPV